MAIRTLCRQSSSAMHFPSLRGPTSFAWSGLALSICAARCLRKRKRLPNHFGRLTPPQAALPHGPKEVGKKTTHRGRAFYKPPSPCVPPPPASEACPASLLGKVLRDRCPCRSQLPTVCSDTDRWRLHPGGTFQSSPKGIPQFFIFHSSFFIRRSGGPKWTRTTDLTIISRVL